MTESRLSEQLTNLQNIDTVQATLPAAKLLRDLAYELYVNQSDPDAFEDEFISEEDPPGAMVIACEEFDISFIEFGTSKMAAQPFMRPSIDNNLDELRAEISKNIQSQIESLIR